MSRAEDPEDAELRRFFAKLRKDPRIVRCGTVYIDVPGVVERRVACGECLDRHRGRSLRSLSGKACCTTFRVQVDRAEIRRIERVLPHVRTIRDVGAAIDRTKGFWHVEDDDLWLNERPGGACVFLSAPPGGPPLCTLHEWAASRGRDHRKVKPESCCLFPLYLTEWRDELLVTSYGSPYWAEMEPGETDDVKDFACFHAARGKGRSLFADQEEEIRYRVGARRFAATKRKLAGLGLLPG